MAQTARHRDIAGLDETGLVAAAQAGSEAAVRSLIRANNQRLFRVARAVLRNDGEAEDVVQETYVKAFTHLGSFRGESAFSTWLTRIALNEALGRKRRRKNTVEIGMIEDGMDRQSAELIQFPTSLRSANPEAEASRAELRNLLEQCVDALPEPLRTVFVLREIEEMSTEEAGVLLALKPQTVKTRLHRARRQIRESIEARLSPGFSEILPFDGARCTGLAGRVVAQLRARSFLA